MSRLVVLAYQLHASSEREREREERENHATMHTVLRHGEPLVLVRGVPAGGQAGEEPQPKPAVPLTLKGECASRNESKAIFI